MARKYDGLTVPQIMMLADHDAVYPRPVAWTPSLGSIRTWRWLMDNGWLEAGTLTQKARDRLHGATP